MKQIRKRMIACVCCLLAALCVCGCAKGGKAVKIELDENPTTGYSWKYTMSQEGVLTEKENVYQKPTTGLMGAGGKHTWSFLPAGDGEVELTFVYAQSWAGGARGESRVYRYRVEKGEITLLSEEIVPAPVFLEQLVRIDNVYLRDGAVVADVVYLESNVQTEKEDGVDMVYETFTEVDGVTHTLIVSADAIVDFSEDFGPNTIEIAPEDFPERFEQVNIDGILYRMTAEDDTITALTFYYVQ